MSAQNFIIQGTDTIDDQASQRRTRTPIARSQPTNTNQQKLNPITAGRVLGRSTQSSVESHVRDQIEPEELMRRLAERNQRRRMRCVRGLCTSIASLMPGDWRLRAWRWVTAYCCLEIESVWCPASVTAAAISASPTATRPGADDVGHLPA